ncbi:hypothetical protein BDW59DRAFT_179598 [Aspergillus cavernicola]|uniref:Acetyl-CoA synthetase-like protein n=1 Tax=Aspergillus cavernicola TaxID=176166 RepID=A0ABR4IET0_9EURO
MIESSLRIDIPITDVASFVFSSGTPSSREAPVYFDAAAPSKCFSLAQAQGFVKQIAKGLEDLGLQADDKVLLCSHNCLFFPVLLWAVLAGRFVFTAASPTASVTELEYQLRDSDAKVILAGPVQATVALEAASRVGLSQDQIYLFCDPDEVPQYSAQGPRPWTEIWRPAAEVESWSWRRIETLQEAQQTTAIINYSSGTTGLPKGVEISHYNAVANSTQLLSKRALVANNPKAQSRKSRLDISGERWLAPLPMYHAYGQAYYCMNAARLGAKVFIMKAFDIQQYLYYMDIYRITFMVSVPAIMATLAKQPNAARFNLQAVETVLSGSAPLSPDLGRMIEKLYLRPGVSVKQGWGMTETTCSITGFAPDDEDDGRSIGWLNPNCTARIEPVEDRDFGGVAPAGSVVGEIWVAGPNVMKCYYKNPKATVATIVEADGFRWLRTGDIGYIDDRGCLYIVDRLKELIKVKGLQVAPAELEQYLLTHPDVADAAVVGAKLNGGEYPRAFVVRKQDVVKDTELLEMIKGHFAPHKWLTGGVYFIDRIPRTGSGKVLRRDLPTLETKISGARARL